MAPPARYDGRRCADCRVTQKQHREVYARGLLTYRAAVGLTYLCCACHKARLSRTAPPERKGQLRHGPYRPPGVRIGERAFCHYRGCEVVVTSFSGPVRWPRGLREGKAGRPSPVVTHDLACAIRRENPWALCSWLGVSITLIRSWRKRLMVD
jgi:hypothetical protein